MMQIKYGIGYIDFLKNGKLVKRITCPFKFSYNCINCDQVSILTFEDSYGSYKICIDDIGYVEGERLTDEMIVSSIEYQMELCLTAGGGVRDPEIDDPVDPEPLPKIGPETIFAVNPQSSSQKPMAFWQWNSQEGEDPCFTDVGDNPNTDPGSIINDFINTYTIMNIIGSTFQNDLAKYATSACIEICLAAAGAITLADAVAQAVAEGIKLPDGTDPSGLVNYSISQLNPGQMAKDANGDKKKLKFGGCLEFNGSPINYGTTVCPPKEVIQDEDCDGKMRGEALTQTLENTGTEDVAFRLCAQWINYDADDTDDAV